MNFPRLATILVACASISAGTAGTSAAVGTGGFPSGQGQDGPAEIPEISGKGYGKVTIGRSYRTLRRLGLVGPIRPGCELGGGNTRSAKLKRPLKGQVEFTLRSPRRVASITITGGSATARDIGVGSTLEELQAEFPGATVNHDTDEVFGVSRVTVPKSEGGKFEFAVDTQTNKVTLIGIPRLSFCE